MFRQEVLKDWAAKKLSISPEDIERVEIDHEVYWKSPDEVGGCSIEADVKMKNGESSKYFDAGDDLMTVVEDIILQAGETALTKKLNET